MKRNTLVLAIAGLTLMITFQNCSQGNFESETQLAAATGKKIEVSDDQIQNWLDRDKVQVCPAIMCAAPPQGCRYEQDTSVDSSKNRCGASCGRLVCDKEAISPIRQQPIICPDILCSEVPDGCRRVASTNTVKDVNGCNASCGDIVCEDKSKFEEVVVEDDESSRRQCPLIRCAAAPANCYYRPESRLLGNAKNNCPTCGTLICKKLPLGTDLPPVPTE